MWGATIAHGVCGFCCGISIHAPRVGCDADLCDVEVVHDISIHAPRVGCDLASIQVSSSTIYFNPRTPCGVRLYNLLGFVLTGTFQSTHPVWGATFSSVIYYLT